MSNSVHFATLDRVRPIDPVEGHVDQFVIEFRDSEAQFVERVFGTRAACLNDSSRRGIFPSAVRITGRAQA